VTHSITVSPSRIAPFGSRGRRQRPSGLKCFIADALTCTAWLGRGTTSTMLSSQSSSRLATKAHVYGVRLGAPHNPRSASEVTSTRPWLSNGPSPSKASLANSSMSSRYALNTALSVPENCIRSDERAVPHGLPCKLSRYRVRPPLRSGPPSSCSRYSSLSLVRGIGDYIRLGRYSFS
jgi:hypothetical protein